MGQKVNPVGLRLGINRGWDSVWYAKKKDFGNYLIEDFKIGLSFLVLDLTFLLIDLTNLESFFVSFFFFPIIIFYLQLLALPLLFQQQLFYQQEYDQQIVLLVQIHQTYVQPYLRKL